MFQTLKSFCTPSPDHEQAHVAYLSIVAQARQPVFYQDWQVPDTLDGRFDLIVLHLFLVLSACMEKLPPPSRGRAGAGGFSIADKITPPPNPLPQGEGEIRAFCRHLSEIFFADMDRSLREIGVTDTGVGKRVKKMAQAFYGRLHAYGAAIGDAQKLKEALKRNVWREQPVDDKSLAALADYMHRNAERLRAGVTSPSFPEFCVAKL